MAAEADRAEETRPRRRRASGAAVGRRPVGNNCIGRPPGRSRWRLGSSLSGSIDIRAAGRAGQPVLAPCAPRGDRAAGDGREVGGGRPRPLEARPSVATARRDAAGNRGERGPSAGQSRTWRQGRGRDHQGPRPPPWAAQRDRALLDTIVEHPQRRGETARPRLDAAYAAAFASRLRRRGDYSRRVTKAIRSRPTGVAAALAVALDDWGRRPRDGQRTRRRGGPRGHQRRHADPNPWRLGLRRPEPPEQCRHALVSSSPGSRRRVRPPRARSA